MPRKNLRFYFGAAAFLAAFAWLMVAPSGPVKIFRPGNSITQGCGDPSASGRPWITTFS